MAAGAQLTNPRRRLFYWLSSERFERGALTSAFVIAASLRLNDSSKRVYASKVAATAG